MFFGERIRLRRDERSDLPHFVEWLNDPDVRRYLSMGLPLSLAGEEQWFEDMLKRPADEQPFAIEVRTETGWKLVGNCGFMNLDHVARCAEVGLFIGDKDFWNRGYGTEVMRLLLRIGFETINLNSIYLRVDEDNAGGIRAYQKAGFTQEGRWRQGCYRDGAYHDVLFMSVLRSEYDEKEKK